MKLEKTLDTPTEDRVQCAAKLRRARKVEVVAERVHHRENSLKLDTDLRAVNTPISAFMTPGREAATHVSGRIIQPNDDSHAHKQKATGKSIWKGRDGEEVNVETVALESYEDDGFKGYIGISSENDEKSWLTDTL